MKAVNLNFINLIVFILLQFYNLQVCSANYSLFSENIIDISGTVEAKRLFNKGLIYFKNADYDSSLYFFEQALFSLILLTLLLKVFY